MTINPQRIALDKIFLELFGAVKQHMERESKKYSFVVIEHDDTASAKAVDTYIQSVAYHEDKYASARGRLDLAQAKKVQPAEGKSAVFDAIQSFCKTTGLSDEDGYNVFMEYFREIPFKNGQYGERDVFSKIRQLQGHQRAV
jgi:hypothetical protein